MCICILHPGVMVAFLIHMSQGAGSIPAGANNFFPPNIVDARTGEFPNILLSGHTAMYDVRNIKIYK